MLVIIKLEQPIAKTEDALYQYEACVGHYIEVYIYVIGLCYGISGVRSASVFSMTLNVSWEVGNFVTS